MSVTCHWVACTLPATAIAGVSDPTVPTRRHRVPVCERHAAAIARTDRHTHPVWTTSLRPFAPRRVRLLPPSETVPSPDPSTPGA